MATVAKRPNFVQQMDNKQIDVQKLKDDAQVKQAMAEAGGSVDQLARADLNRDGKIAGAAESKALFKELDRFDSNGNAASFVVENEAGTTTPQGKVFDRLSFLAENRTVQETAPLTPEQKFGKAVGEAGRNSIEQKMTGHNKAIDETGVGLYYGDHSSYKSKSSAEKKQWIEDNKKPGTDPSMPKESSCIGWAYENVGAAYRAAGKGERWSEIIRSVAAKGSKGTDLAMELKKDGWESVYWNPDAKNPDDGNAEHSFSARQAKRGKGYYGIEIDHMVTDYRPTPGKSTTQDMSGVEKLREVPFFFGLAKGGKHTFVGRDGKVNEFHWSDMPNSKNAIEENALEKFMWNSGVIMVPPGSWPTE